MFGGVVPHLMLDVMPDITRDVQATKGNAKAEATFYPAS